jgi:hypothetical protein
MNDIWGFDRTPLRPTSLPGNGVNNETRQIGLPGEPPYLNDLTSSRHKS